ncbi:MULTISPECIES: hypothetical protein [Floridanema]
MAGQEGYFTRCTSPRERRDSVDYNDGVTGTTYKHLGFTSRENVTLSKPFDPAKDKALIEFYRKQVAEGGETFNVSIQPVTVDLQGKPIDGAGTFILNECQFAGANFPETDRMGNNMSMLEFEIVFNTWTYQ